MALWEAGLNVNFKQNMSTLSIEARKSLCRFPMSAKAFRFNTLLVTQVRDFQHSYDQCRHFRTRH